MRLPVATAFPLQRPEATPRARVEEAARGLESQFAQMLIKSMREASFGDSLFPGENQMFREMYDQKIAEAMTRGRGLGLSAMIARQLGGVDAAAQPALDTGLNPAKAEFFKIGEMWMLMRRFGRHQLFLAMAEDLGYHCIPLPTEARRQAVLERIAEVQDRANNEIAAATPHAQSEHCNSNLPLTEQEESNSDVAAEAQLLSGLTPE